MNLESHYTYIKKKLGIFIYNLYKYLIIRCLILLIKYPQTFYPQKNVIEKNINLIINFTTICKYIHFYK